ncbi:MAG: DNA-binding protein WhiA [Lachnospiraceae bacterium]|nr:DNA-binding protein WhiA [Lachnospiraceae bacterium]
MSFSSGVKEELAKQIGLARHCQIAEIAAIISLCGKVLVSPEQEYSILIHTENEVVARKYFTLLKKAFKIGVEISIGKSKYARKSNVYSLLLDNQTEALRVVKATHSSAMLQNDCCRRAYLRGAFLAAGSISDPEKSYHLEIDAATETQAQKIQEVMNGFELEAKIVSRKKMFVVYLKEGAQIVELLGLMGANISLMNLENVRIFKDMRNSVNRKVNCEAANINKTIHAAVNQIEDIEYIRDTTGLTGLTPNLKEMAEVRLDYPDATLAELGTKLNPPVGKSGVNHRLRRLSELAQELRGNEEEKDYD